MRNFVNRYLVEDIIPERKGRMLSFGISAEMYYKVRGKLRKKHGERVVVVERKGIIYNIRGVTVVDYNHNPGSINTSCIMRIASPRRKEVDGLAKKLGLPTKIPGK